MEIFLIWQLPQLVRITDTSASEARRGKDIQGIPWGRLQVSKQEYRKTRVEQYKNYENFPNSSELVERVCPFTTFLFI